MGILRMCKVLRRPRKANFGVRRLLKGLPKAILCVRRFPLKPSKANLDESNVLQRVFLRCVSCSQGLERPFLVSVGCPKGLQMLFLVGEDLSEAPQTAHWKSVRSPNRYFGEVLGAHKTTKGHF